jgi:hypothetical protein
MRSDLRTGACHVSAARARSKPTRAARQGLVARNARTFHRAYSPFFLLGLVSSWLRTRRGARRPPRSASRPSASSSNSRESSQPSRLPSLDPRAKPQRPVMWQTTLRPSDKDMLVLTQSQRALSAKHRQRPSSTSQFCPCPVLSPTSLYAPFLLSSSRRILFLTCRSTQHAQILLSAPSPVSRPRPPIALSPPASCPLALSLCRCSPSWPSVCLSLPPRSR